MYLFVCFNDFEQKSVFYSNFWIAYPAYPGLEWYFLSWWFHDFLLVLCYYICYGIYVGWIPYWKTTKMEEYFANLRNVYSMIICKLIDNWSNKLRRMHITALPVNSDLSLGILISLLQCISSSITERRTSKQLEVIMSTFSAMIDHKVSKYSWCC